MEKNRVKKLKSRGRKPRETEMSGSYSNGFLSVTFFGEVFFDGTWGVL